jgi:hypothetical protein
MIDPKLRSLIEELNEAEMQHFDVEGPLLMRLHEAIVALCDYAGIANLWNQPEEGDADLSGSERQG